MKKNWGRSKLIINPEFQFRIIGYIMLASLAFAGILYLSNFYFIHKFQNIGESLKLDTNHPYFQLLQEQQNFLTKVFVVDAIAFVGLLFWGGVVLTHRIAGPILHVCRHLQEVTDKKRGLGDKIHLRKHDFFPELADIYNHFSSQLDEEHKNVTKPQAKRA